MIQTTIQMPKTFKWTFIVDVYLTCSEINIINAYTLPQTFECYCIPVSTKILSSKNWIQH